MAKSAGSCGLITFTEEILNGKLHFLCSHGYGFSRKQSKNNILNELKDIKTYASFYIILKDVGKRELKSIKQSNYYHCITCKIDVIVGKITKQTIKVNFKIRKYSYSNKT